MKHLFKFIVALGVFTMTIGSSFAMDNNPPTEPVKAIVETEVMDDAPMQTPYTGPYYYKDSSGNCVELLSGPTNCTLTNTSINCMWVIGGIAVRLHGGFIGNPNNGDCELINPLFEIPTP